MTIGVVCYRGRERAALIAYAERQRAFINRQLREGIVVMGEKRGFASMSKERQREIASKGGKSAHARGTAHQWTSEEAAEAGRKGGTLSRGGRGKLVEGDLPEASNAAREVA